MAKKYRSEIMGAIHETATGLREAGIVSTQTMKSFDELCLTSVTPLSPKRIRAIRMREGASQAVFARYLNVTTGLISQWERGEKRPSGPALKLLTLVDKKGLQFVA